MMPTLLATTALISSFGATAVLAASAADPLAFGDRISSMSASAILGAVAFACVCAMRAMYADQKTASDNQRKADAQIREQLLKDLRASTEAHQKAADAQASVAGVLVEVKDAMKECRKNGVYQ